MGSRRRYAKEIVRGCRLDENSNGVESAAMKDTGEEDDEVLVGGETKEYRRLAATGNYLGQDRMDIQCATKEICRHMAGPTVRGQEKLRRLARYLVEHQRLVWTFRRGGARDWIEAYTDSDWADCKTTRKSTSGGVVTLGGCALKSWSRMQSYVALSSAEAELYALVGTAVEALGVQALMNDS